MTIFIDVLGVAIGAIFIGFGHRIARARISLHYSYEELRATSGPRRARVRRATIIGTILNLAVGGTLVALGLRSLIG